MDRHPLLAPEQLVGAAADDQLPLPLATEGIQRWVWQSRFGPMLIEIIDDTPYVNGQRVDRAAPGPGDVHEAGDGSDAETAPRR